MCGICGIFDLAGNPVSEAALWRMIGRIKHRGPDDCGVKTLGTAGLGHARLSIIDLSAAGHQPMTNEDETVWITYNGELYNYLDLRTKLEYRHSFRSQTDTEVILHAYEEWGEDCVRQFNGIFAFAIYDHVRRRLFAARDPIGVKPFYYHSHGARICFASEVKALFGLDIAPMLAKENVAEYLMYGWLADERTLFAGVKSLEPGHQLIVQAAHPSEIKVTRYYSLASRVDPREYQRWDRTRPDEAVEYCSHLLERSVTDQMISDVPIGTLCSGGVDSSLVTALALKHNPETRIEGVTARHTDQTSGSSSGKKRTPFCNGADRV